MRILIALNHPAHYYLFKNVAQGLKNKGHELNFVIKQKDILEQLLISEEVKYTKLISRKRRKNNLFSILSQIVIEMIQQDYYLWKFMKSFSPDILLGTDIAITHLGKLKGIPSIVFNEDDLQINKLFCYSSYPFATHILTPVNCEVGKYNTKQIKYNGYQKLAYLHPNWFKPDINVVRKYFNDEKPYFLIRLVSFTASHDIELKHSGLSNGNIRELISTLSDKGNIFISSEEELLPEFSDYQLKADVKDIHHILYFSHLLIGDSQSMIVEAAMLGTPSIRFNSFAGKISVLNELEDKYHLTTAINPENPEYLIQKTNELISTKNLKEIYQVRRHLMLADKIDVSAFLIWLIENYPQSKDILIKNPDFQMRFK